MVVIDSRQPETTAARQGAGHAAGVGVIVLSMTSANLGAGIAAGLFDEIPASSVVLLRQAGAAAVLLAWARPRLRRRPAGDWQRIVAFGLVLSVMNQSLYAAFERLPLGIAVTIELLGPLGLAAMLSRRRSEFAAVGLAIAGIVLLGRGDSDFDLAGAGFAVIAAVCWACYILLGRAAGKHGSGIDTLALSLVVATCATLPLGVGGGAAMVRPHVLATAAVVAVLSAVIPFSLDRQALRMLPTRLFGVLQSLHPVFAALSGLLVLGQRLSTVQILGVGLVVLASGWSVVGSTRWSGGWRSALRSAPWSLRNRRRRGIRLALAPCEPSIDVAGGRSDGGTPV